MRTINLYNRYGYNLKMVEIAEGKWKLDFSGFPEWETFRVIGEYHDLKAIDPAGGPFISVGFKITDGESVKKILREYNDYVFYTKEGGTEDDNKN